ncbi:MAG: hypothetical protein AB1638_06375 [Nitrospirota bacterium]
MILVVIIASCSTKHPVETALDENQILKERVDLFCKARQQHDWETIQSLVDPDIREQFNQYFERLKKERKMAEVLECNIKNISTEGERARVTTKLIVRFSNPLFLSLPPQEYEMKDMWIRRNGLWYLIIEQPNFKALFDKFMIQEKERR